ncbi:Golgi membrane protein 1-like [Ambystoma mexicanum]|uniref:Golgi membrane protein 1-like n=1 Tax=Ambystoma mexicanum TaxID=8296 RepID=UPI0037E8760B
MMGFLPETSRLRTPATLVVILLACMALLGYTYWSEFNRSVIYRNRIAFLERHISKASKVEEEDDGREEDFQKELRRQGQRMQQMNAMVRQQMERLSSSCQMEKDQLLRAIESKSSVISDKEELISHMMAEQQKLEKEMEVFQSNQSQLMEKYSLLAAKVEPLIKLKESCYAQLASISRGSAASAGSQRAEEKVPKEDQSGTNAVDDKKGIVPVVPPAANLPAPSPVIRVPSVRPQVENLPKNIPINSVPKVEESEAEDEKRVALPVAPAAAKLPQPRSSALSAPLDRRPAENPPKNVSVNSVPKEVLSGANEEDDKKGAVPAVPPAAKLPAPSPVRGEPTVPLQLENQPKNIPVNSVKVSDIIIQTLKKTTPISRKVEEKDNADLSLDEEDQEPMGGDPKEPVDQKQPAKPAVDKMDNAIPKDQEEDNVVEEENEEDNLLD